MKSELLFKRRHLSSIINSLKDKFLGTFKSTTKLNRFSKDFSRRTPNVRSPTWTNTRKLCSPFLKITKINSDCKNFSFSSPKNYNFYWNTFTLKVRKNTTFFWKCFFTRFLKRSRVFFTKKYSFISCTSSVWKWTAMKFFLLTPLKTTSVIFPWWQDFCLRKFKMKAKK